MERTPKEICKDLKRSQEFFARCGLVTEANLIAEAISTLRKQAKEIERLKGDDGK